MRRVVSFAAIVHATLDANYIIGYRQLYSNEWLSYAIMATSAVLNIVFGVAIYNLRTENTKAAELQLRPGVHVGTVTGADL